MNRCVDGIKRRPPAVRRDGSELHPHTAQLLNVVPRNILQSVLQAA